MTKDKHPKNLMIARQGDVGIMKVAANQALAKTATKKQEREGTRLILAHGEVTGHSHAIEARGANLYIDDSVVVAPDAMEVIARIGGGVIPDRLLKTTEPTDLRHEEHATLAMPEQGVIRIQREWAGSQSRSAAD